MRCEFLNRGRGIAGPAYWVDAAMRLAALCLSFLMLLAAEAEASCVRFPHTLRWNIGDVHNVNWTVQPGGVCPFHIWGRQFAVFAIEIPTRPKHGIVGHEAGYRIAYKAASNFRGTDSFVIRIIGKQGGTPGAVIINVTVTIN
jgi:hypothetical protein